MSEEALPSNDNPAPAGEQGTPRVRRISNPRPKKPVKRAVSGDAGEGAVQSDASLRVEAPKVASKFPEFPSSGDRAPEGAALDHGVEESAGDAGGDWSEAEPATVGGATGQEGGKRKRRRKKGKGGGQQAAGAPQAQPTLEQDVIAGDAPSAGGGQQAVARPAQVQPQRPKVDAELLAKFAWKIYLAEVSEEGVALIGDNDARELSRRCFRLAEIFLEEQSRRR